MEIKSNFIGEVKIVSKFIQSTVGPISFTWKLFIPTNNVELVILCPPIGVEYVNKLKVVLLFTIPSVNRLNNDAVTPLKSTFE